MNGTDLVVVGLGYVGLPLAREAVQAGLTVVGLDASEAKVEALRAGQSYVDDLDDGTVADLVARGFTPTTDPSAISEAATVVICVPTPLTIDGGPDLTAVTDAARTIARGLRRGQLIVLESTSYPGTTEEVVGPLLEESGLTVGTDFHLAYSPERIDPGNPLYGLRNTPKVVGGATPACTDAAVAFYSKVVHTVVPVAGTREAEMAKLLENTYRHVNIALVNEMAIFCDELGVDLWEAIAAAGTKPFGFHVFHPGPGVGGHCIPIDPNYLSYKVRTLGYPFRFVELAQEINARMPSYVATRAQRLLNSHCLPVNGTRILLLGVTYKADIADERESPALHVARRLLDLGADLSYHDPYVPRWRVGGRELPCAPDVSRAVHGSELVVLLQAHSSYDLDGIVAEASLLLDTRGCTAGPRVERL